MQNSAPKQSWLNRTVLGVGLTSLFSDWSHETATAVLPAFLAAIGAGPAWLGAIEGIADGLSSFAKLAAGHFTDRLKRRKPLAVFGYAFTALATASFAFATHAYHVLFARAAAWLGRGVRSPAKKALLAADVPPNAYGRAFGLERLMDTLGAIGGPLTALWLLEATGHSFRKVFLWTLLPGMMAVAALWLLVRERAMEARPQRSFLIGLKALPPSFRRLVLGVGVFGAGDFCHSLLHRNKFPFSARGDFHPCWTLHRHGRSPRRLPLRRDCPQGTTRHGLRHARRRQRRRRFFLQPPGRIPLERLQRPDRLHRLRHPLLRRCPSHPSPSNAG